MTKNIIPLNKEYTYNGSTIISQTDLDGNIIYANNMFCEISGYSKEELLGHSQNIIRHPDMPKKIFENMWKTIKSEKVWNGIVKNLRKDGSYYWVDSEILPTYDEETKELNGFIAARKNASRTNIQEAEILYKNMKKMEK